MSVNRSTTPDDKTVSVTVKLKRRVRRAVVERATADGMSPHRFMVRAVNRALRYGAGPRDDDLTFAPSGVSSMDTWLSLVAAGRDAPLRSMVAAGTYLGDRLRSRLRSTLPPTHARRVERVIVHGDSYSAVAVDEGVSKQAIHQSVRRGLEILRDDDAFLEALCETINPEARLSPSMLRSLK